MISQIFTNLQQLRILFSKLILVSTGSQGQEVLTVMVADALVKMFFVCLLRQKNEITNGSLNFMQKVVIS
jgi:UDP-N-acetylglucosamine:LPS N-acetylglucosamine transferase